MPGDERFLVKYVDEVGTARSHGRWRRRSPRSWTRTGTIRLWRSAGPRTICRHGIEDLLPEGVELVHGPGAAVCVLPMGRVDEGIESPSDLLLRGHDAGAGLQRGPPAGDSKAEGADIRMNLFPLDALRIARENPDREVVFYAIQIRDHGSFTALTCSGPEGGHRELLRLLQSRDHPVP